jgi:hypothetical protein
VLRVSAQKPKKMLLQRWKKTNIRRWRRGLCSLEKDNGILPDSPGRIDREYTELTFTCHQKNRRPPLPKYPLLPSQSARTNCTRKMHRGPAVQRRRRRQRDNHHRPPSHANNDEEESEKKQGIPLGGKREGSGFGSRRFHRKRWTYTIIPCNADNKFNLPEQEQVPVCRSKEKKQPYRREPWSLVWVSLWRMSLLMERLYTSDLIDSNEIAERQRHSMPVPLWSLLIFIVRPQTFDLNDSHGIAERQRTRCASLFGAC